MRPLTVVIDTTVLVGFCDPDDPLHQVSWAALVECVTAGNSLVVPVSVLSEALVGAYRATPHAVRTVEGFVDDIATRLYPIDRPVGRVAARYRADHPGLPLAAALVFGTAKVVSAQQILTTEPSWKDIDDRTRVLR
jgi:predicted nucleic acid-binding protein